MVGNKCCSRMFSHPEIDTSHEMIQRNTQNRNTLSVHVLAKCLPYDTPVTIKEHNTPDFVDLTFVPPLQRLHNQPPNFSNSQTIHIYFTNCGFGCLVMPRNLRGS